MRRVLGICIGLLLAISAGDPIRDEARFHCFITLRTLQIFFCHEFLDT